MRFDDIEEYMNNPASRADFNHPPRDYESKKLLDWDFLIEKELIATDAALAERAQKKLENKLKQMLAIFPQKAQKIYSSLKLFLMGGKNMHGGGYDSGAEYHQKIAPQFYAYLDPQMASSIVIYSAKNYDWLSDFWSLKVLVHEFSHAYHLEQWPEDKPEIVKAWQHAIDNNLYKEVVRHDGTIIKKGYAISNAMEYFAELSCMYYCGCEYTPYSRSELKKYDSTGFAMIEQVWR